MVKLSNLDFSGSEADKPRRSFATYLFNKDRFSADKQLARIMGNTPYVLKKHYKNIIKAGEGKKYFQVGPKGEIMSDEYLKKLS